MILWSCNTLKKDKQNLIENEQPIILLIVVDDQGYADFSPFVAHDKTISTPNISRLGKSGTVYTQAYVMINIREWKPFNLWT